MQPIQVTNYFIMKPPAADSATFAVAEDCRKGESPPAADSATFPNHQVVVEAYVIHLPTDFPTVNKTIDCSDVCLQVVYPKEFAGRRIQASQCIPCQGPAREFEKTEEYEDFLQEAIRQVSMIANFARALEKGENDWGC